MLLDTRMCWVQTYAVVNTRYLTSGCSGF